MEASPFERVEIQPTTNGSLLPSSIIHRASIFEIDQQYDRNLPDSVSLSTKRVKSSVLGIEIMFKRNLTPRVDGKEVAAPNHHSPTPSQNAQRKTARTRSTFVLFWAIAASSLFYFLQTALVRDRRLYLTDSVSVNEQVSGVEEVHSSFLKIVQIGANDGSPRGNDRTLRRLLADSRNEAVLVEGNPQVYELLLQTIAQTYQNSPRIHPINALVCPEGKDFDFYVVNSNLKRDFPNAPHWVLYQISSLEKNSTMTGLNFYFQQKRVTDKNAEDYISSMKIPCTPFAKILQSGNFEPKDVDVLAVDVEGHDANVLLEALKLPGFSPDMIIFESKGSQALFPDELEQVFQILDQRGYTTNCRMRNDGRRTCPEDVEATKKDGGSGKLAAALQQSKQ